MRVGVWWGKCAGEGEDVMVIVVIVDWGGAVVLHAVWWSTGV